MFSLMMVSILGVSINQNIERTNYYNKLRDALKKQLTEIKTLTE